MKQMGKQISESPLNIAEFRKFQEAFRYDLVIPQVPEKRKVTDLRFATFFGISLGLLAVCLIYCSTQADLHDFRYPFAWESTEFIGDAIAALRHGAVYFAILICIGGGVCWATLLLFKHHTTFMIWLSLIGTVIEALSLTLYFWSLASNSSENEANDKTLFDCIALIFTIATIVLLALIVYLRKKIKLVIRLIKEAIKTVFDIPFILVQSLLTFMFLSLLLLFAFFLIFMLLSIDFNQGPTVFIRFTLIFTIIMFFWIFLFIKGCQYMIVSGAVSAYYFARDKTVLVSPIYNSFYNLITYHLGTVAFGSAVLTIISVIRCLIENILNEQKTRLLCKYCLSTVEKSIKYLSKNAYIQTAMHGQNFYKSGKRAAHLLVANAMSAIAVNSVASFIILGAKLLACSITATAGIVMMMMMMGSDMKAWPTIIITAVLITGALANHVFAVFETAIDTLFLCFCEDMSINDGVTRPYYVSINFMQYIEGAKAAEKEKQENVQEKI